MSGELTKVIAKKAQINPPTSTIDNRLHNTIYAEVGGGSPEEVSAVTTVFLNRVKKEGYEKALLGSSAYRLKSKEYQKAESNKLNPYEKSIYDRNKLIVESLSRNTDKLAPYTHFENIKAFGEPKWAKGMKYKDVGRQRFYWKE